MMELSVVDDLLVSRVLSKLDITDTCWLWLGAKDSHGYGQIKYKGSMRLVHRILYIVLVEDVQEQLDHTCRVKTCVNPDHLEPTTASVNIRRRYGWSETETGIPLCPLKHEVTGSNAYTTSKNTLACRRCTARKQRVYRRNLNAG